MYSFKPEVLDRLLSHGITKAVGFIHEARGKQELYEKRTKSLEALREAAIIQSTESSNRLENVVVSQEVLRTISKTGKPINRNDRNEAEIAGYLDVLNTIHNSQQDMPFTPNLVLQIHRDLMQFTREGGGSWKKAPNQIIQRHADGSETLRAHTSPPHLVADHMAQLHESFAHAINQGMADPLILIALYVLDFLCIHPFDDGNGRTARLLTVLLLYHHDYQMVRYVSMERTIEKTKVSYYDTLYRSDRGWHDGGSHNPKPWVEYFLGVLVAISRQFVEKADSAQTQYGQKKVIVLAVIGNMHGDFSISDLQKECPSVSRDTLHLVLRELKEQGGLALIGSGRGAKWRKTGMPLQ